MPLCSRGLRPRAIRQALGPCRPAARDRGHEGTWPEVVSHRRAFLSTGEPGSDGKGTSHLDLQAGILEPSLLPLRVQPVGDRGAATLSALLAMARYST